MGIEVYANNMSIACKAADGKSIAAFPDVCFTPPLTPATPPGVPIPYPNTSMASDTTDGTKTVMINGKEVMLKNISVFKTSTGDEAGSAPKKGVITSTIKGKANFICYSMDVKFEGENVPRNLDMMGHNEQSDPSDTPPWPYIDKLTVPVPSRDPECPKLEQEIDEVINRDKHNPTDGRPPGEGTHGLRHRFGEQIYGAQGPGSVGWDTHDQQIAGGQGKLKRLLKRHQEKDCGPAPPMAHDWAERQRPQDHQYRGPGYQIFGPPIF